MKQVIAFIQVLLAGVLILMCFSGCYTKPQDKQVESKSTVISEISIPKKSEETIEYTASLEIEQAALYSNVMQVGNTIFTKPPEYNDFIKAGAVFATKDATEDYLINPDETKAVNMKIGSTEIKIIMKNNIEQPCALKNAEVENSLYADGPEVFFPMGVRVGKSLAFLTEKWGQPSVDKSKSSDKFLTYRYFEYPIELKRVNNSPLGENSEIISATGFDYTVTIDRNTSQITSIFCKWVNKSLEDTVKNVSREEQFANGNISILSYKVPYKFLNNTITLGGKMLTVYKVDNTPYIFVLGALTGRGNVKGEVSEAQLIEALNPKHSSTFYEIDKIKITDTVGTAIGYIKTDEGYKCATVYLNSEKQYITDDSMLIPLDKNGTITEAALSKFKEVMEDFVTSISLSEQE